MPTTIDSAGITFNDTTSLTSANIGTAQLVNGSVIASKLGTTEQKQIAKAWVNFNGTTSPGTIRSSFNVSSVTKTGTGFYVINFTTSMTDANYTAAGLGSNYTTGADILQPNIYGFNTSSLNVSIRNSAATSYVDVSSVSIQIFGN
jgi:hypothetical protein